MIVVCTNCSTRLQLNPAKVPDGSFSVRCPKCMTTVTVEPQNGLNGHDALSVGNTPALDSSRFRQPVLAPVYEYDGEEKKSGRTEPGEERAEPSELIHAIASLLGSQAGGGRRRGDDDALWEQQRALVCAAQPLRDHAARALASHGFRVFVAENTGQALETLRTEHLDALLLDPSFDAVEKGAAFVTNEVNSLRAPDRRKLFVVQLSPSARTFDSHAAFLNNVNLVVNPNDLESLGPVLDRAKQSFNDLYRNFKLAMRAMK